MALPIICAAISAPSAASTSDSASERPVDLVSWHMLITGTGGRRGLVLQLILLLASCSAGSSLHTSAINLSSIPCLP